MSDTDLDVDVDDDFTPEAWRPIRHGIDRDLANLKVPKDPAREFDDDETHDFFKLFSQGYGEMEIGLSLWGSPAAVRRFLADPDRAEIMAALRERRHEGMERAIYRTGLNGNPTAQRLYAHSQMKHRGWADQRSVQVDVQSQQEIVVSVRKAMTEKTKALIGDHGADGVAALQAAFADDDDIVDGEVVGEDVHPR